MRKIYMNRTILYLLLCIDWSCSRFVCHATGKDDFSLIYVKCTNEPTYLLKHFLFSTLFFCIYNRPYFSLLTLVDDILRIWRRRRGEPFCEQTFVTTQEYTSKRFTSELRGFNHGTSA